MPENQDAAMIYQMVQGQTLRAGIEGAVTALNQLAVWEAIDRYEAKYPIECFEKVIGTFGHMLAEQRNKEPED